MSLGDGEGRGGQPGGGRAMELWLEPWRCQFGREKERRDCATTAPATEDRPGAVGEEEGRLRVLTQRQENGRCTRMTSLRAEYPIGLKVQVWTTVSFAESRDACTLYCEHAASRFPLFKSRGYLASLLRCAVDARTYYLTLPGTYLELRARPASSHPPCRAMLSCPAL